MSYVSDIRVQHQLYLHSTDLRLALLWYILIISRTGSHKYCRKQQNVRLC